MSDIEQWEAEGGACPQEDRSLEGVRGMIEDLSAYEQAMREEGRRMHEEAFSIARGGEQEDFGQIYIPVEQMSSEEWGKILGSGPGKMYLMESPVPSVQFRTDPEQFRIDPEKLEKFSQAFQELMEACDKLGEVSVEFLEIMKAFRRISDSKEE